MVAYGIHAAQRSSCRRDKDIWNAFEGQVRKAYYKLASQQAARRHCPRELTTYVRTVSGPFGAWAGAALVNNQPRGFCLQRISNIKLWSSLRQQLSWVHYPALAGSVEQSSVDKDVFSFYGHRLRGPPLTPSPPFLDTASIFV